MHKDTVEPPVLALLLRLLFPWLGQLPSPIRPTGRRVTVPLLERLLLGPVAAGPLTHLALHVRVLALLLVPYAWATLGQLLPAVLLALTVLARWVALFPCRQFGKSLPLLMVPWPLVLVRNVLAGVVT